MSKDLTISAKSFHDQVNTNQIGYKNESIGDSILPHLVKRARLNPTVTTSTKIYEVTENGETITEEVEEQAIEMRHYYSLHNDSSQTVYVSPTIRLENSLPGGAYTDIPNKPDEIPEPDVLNPSDDPYIPVDPDNPNPIPGPSLPPGELIIPPILPPGNTDDLPSGPGTYDPSDSPIVNPEPGNGLWPNGPESNNGTPPTVNIDNFILSSTIIGKHNSTNGNTPPGGGGGGGGGFATNNNTGHNSTNHQTKEFMTDFDDYAEWLVNEPWVKMPTGVIAGDTSSVVRWHHNRSMMETAKNAMKNTRSPFKNRGWKISERYAKLLYADSMYEGSYVSEATLEIPKVTSAPRMFADTPNLKTLEIKKADLLVNASEFCKGSSVKTVSISDAKLLTNITDGFVDCKNLTKLTLLDANSLQSISFSLPKLSVVKISGSFPGTLSNVFKNCQLLYDVDLTLKNTTELSNIIDVISGHALDYIKINGKKLTSFGNIFSACPNLIAIDITTGTSFTAANNLFTGLRRLEKVKCKFKGTTNMEAICKDCTGLERADIVNDFNIATVEEGSPQGGVINGDEAFYNCRRLPSIPDIAYYFQSAKKTFAKCRRFKVFEGRQPFEFKDGTEFLAECINLKEVNIQCTNVENFIGGFMYCKALQSAIIGLGMNNIDATSLFESDYELTRVTIPADKIKIANRMFLDCSKLTTIISTSEFSNLTEANFMFSGCINFPNFDYNFDKLVNANYMFNGCESLTDVKLAINGENSDLEGIFYGCTSLKSATVIAPKATNVSVAFARCNKLNTLNCDFSTISKNQLYNLFTDASSELESDIPMSRLENVDITVGNSVDDIYLGTKNGEYYNGAGGLFLNRKALKNVNFVGPGVTNAACAFRGCENLTKVRGDFSNVTTADWMFSLCTNLTDIEDDIIKNATRIPLAFNKSGINRIINTPNITLAIQAYCGCPNLTYADCSGWNYIQNAVNLFYGCSNLRKINLTFNTSAKQLNIQNMLQGCPIEEVEAVKFPDDIILGDWFMKDCKLNYTSFNLIFTELVRLKSGRVWVGVTPATADEIIRDYSTARVNDNEYAVFYNPNNLNEGDLRITINR